MDSKNSLNSFLSINNNSVDFAAYTQIHNNYKANFYYREVSQLNNYIKAHSGSLMTSGIGLLKTVSQFFVTAVSHPPVFIIDLKDDPTAQTTYGNNEVSENSYPAMQHEYRDKTTSSFEDDWIFTTEEDFVLPEGENKKKNLSAQLQSLPKVVVSEDSRLATESREVFFARGVPVLSDIAQNKARDTCYLLSSLAAYIVSPKARQALMEAIDFEEQNVGLRLYHPVLEHDVFIWLPLQKDESRYSYSHNGSLWPACFEQAFLALSVATVQCADEILRNCSQQQREIYGAQFESYKGSDGKPGIDWSELTHAMSHFPKVGEDGVNSPIKLDSIDDENIETIKKNVRAGVPIILGTKNVELNSAYFAATDGIPTSHAVAVIREAYIYKGANPIEGVLVFDPYGQDVKYDSQLDSLLNNRGAMGYAGLSINVQDESAVRFIPWEQLSKRFGDAVIARGGLR